MTRPHGHWRIAAATLALLASAGTVAVAFGLAGGAYVVDSAFTTGGGGRSTGGAYAMQGAIGQPFSGMVQGSGYVLTNGVIPGAAAADVPTFRLFTPALVSNP